MDLGPALVANDTMEAALSYAAVGLRVFPCKPRGKTPLTSDGLKSATTDPDTIRAWWAQWPDANVAIRTGPESGVAVLDIDPRHGGSRTLEQLERRHGRLPRAPQALTGSGGMHLYFAYPAAGMRNSAGRIGAGIDTRGQGGYVVAPPSVHETGNPYKWLRPPDGFPEQPEWLLETGTSTTVAPAGLLPEKIPHGQQHYELVSIAGTMRRRGLTADEIFAALWKINLGRCELPGPEENIRQIARSVAAYAPDTPLRTFTHALGTSTNGPAEQEPAVFRGLTHAEVLALEFPAERMLVDDLIPIGAVGTIAGVPETYKSWQAQAIAVAVAAGQGSVFGKHVTHAGPVGYFWQDDSTREEAERIKLYDQVRGGGPGLQLRWFLNEGLRLPEHMASLGETIEHYGLILVVLDSFYNVLFGLDLKDEQAEQVVALLKSEISDQTGCTILIVDHMPWATEQNRKRLRAYGGVFKNAATRYGIYLDAIGNKLYAEARGNNITGFKRTLVEWDTELLELKFVETTGPVGPDEYEQRVVDWIALHPGLTTTEVDTGVVGDTSEIKAARNRLLEQNRIRKDKKSGSTAWLWNLQQTSGMQQTSDAESPEKSEVYEQGRLPDFRTPTNRESAEVCVTSAGEASESPFGHDEDIPF